MTTIIKGVRTDPKTKADLLNRMMSLDFSGDIRDLAVGRDLKFERIRPNAVRLKFGNSGSSFDLTIHKPRAAAESLSASQAVQAAASGSAGGRRKKNTRGRGGAPPGKRSSHGESRTSH